MQAACRIFIFRQAVLWYDKVIPENTGIKETTNEKEHETI